MASRGQIWAHTSQPVHNEASMSALGRCRRASNSTLFRMAGLNAYHDVAQPLEQKKLFGMHLNGQKTLR